MVVHPSSHRVSRVRRYSGYQLSVFSFVYGILTLYDWLSHAIRLDLSDHDAGPNPRKQCLLVWPLPRSLATTYGISFDVSSSPYLDVSVQAVPPTWLCIHHAVTGYDSSRIAPFGHLRIDVCLPLPAAFRSLPRPSSASDAKAFALRPL